MPSPTLHDMEVDTLDGLVERTDWVSLRDILAGLDEDDLADATRWYRRSGRAQARKAADLDWRGHARIVQLLLALTLSETAEEASKNCQWGRQFSWSDVGGIQSCANALIRRGQGWAEVFVGLAAAATFRGTSERGLGEVPSLVSAAIAAHDLPVPLTETYARGWAAALASAHVHANAGERAANWLPFTMMTVGSGETAWRATPAYPLGPDLTLRDCLAGTREVTGLLATALTHPNALADWASFTEVKWAVAPTIRSAVRDGLVDRPRLLEAAFAALSRDDRAHNQRAVAEILRGLDPTPAEIRERAALILHVLPTVHGHVTKALLDMALAADLPDEDLLDLGTVILARPEKAQKVRLVSHLAALDAASSASSASSARETLLTMASASADATLAAKARALLGSPGAVDGAVASAAECVAELPSWTHAVEPFAPGPFIPYAVSAAGLDQARSDEETWARITTEAAWLDLVVRFAHQDLPGLRDVVSPAPDPYWHSQVRTPFLLHQWVKAGQGVRSYQVASTSRVFTGDAAPRIEHHTTEMLPPAHLLFTDRLVEETLPRLGSLPELLSTPSLADGTLDVRDLAERVRRARDVGYGRYDLVQALLRLGPTRAGDVDLFQGLTLAPVGEKPRGTSWWSRRGSGTSERDGVEVIRSWIAARGWRPRRVDFPVVEPRTSALALPLPQWLGELDGLAGIARAIGTDSDERRPWGSDAPGPWLGVCPWDVEQLATMVALREDQESVEHAQRLPLMVWSAGPIGPAMHHQLARLLAHPRLDSRLLAAQQVGAIARQGRLYPELLRERSEALFAEGGLSLTRAAHGWSELATLSSMSVVWPTWRSLLDLACSSQKKPAGLADLLRATREHAPLLNASLGADWLPASVQQLADAPGSTKAAVEARELVSARHTEGL